MDLELLGLVESDLLKVCGTIEGTDSDDREYTDIISFWSAEMNKRDIRDKVDIEWYSKAYDYWESEEKCKVTDDGVLAGFGFLTPMDTKESNLFLNALKKTRPALRFEKAADCGAGIGRVTKNLLLPRFTSVDMIEQSPRLLGSAAAYIGEGSDRVIYINEGLQHFKPECIYDVIWIQWVVGHLTDQDYISFFQRCIQGLRTGGVIILKDNCSERSTFMVDREDSSVARHVDYHQVLFARAGLKVIKVKRQKDFPKELCPVIMFALVSANEC
jgi:protein N-terminal methyltransferase